MVVVLVMVARTALLAKAAEAMVRVTGLAANMGCIVAENQKCFAPRGLRKCKKRYVMRLHKKVLRVYAIFDFR